MRISDFGELTDVAWPSNGILFNAINWGHLTVHRSQTLAKIVNGAGKGNWRFNYTSNWPWQHACGNNTTLDN